MKHNILKRALRSAAIMLCVAAALLACSCGRACRLYASTLDWAVATIKDNYYYDVEEEDIRAAGLENLSGNVLDVYSRYYTLEEYLETVASNAGGRSGIGVSYTYIEPSAGAPVGSGIYITAVLGNSPAFRSGLRAGTFVTGGITLEGEVTTFENKEQFSAFVQQREVGEQFTLVTDRGNYTVERSDYYMSYCRMATCDGEYDIVYDSYNLLEMEVEYTPSQRYSYLPQGAAYISLSQFFGNAVSEMSALIEQFNALGCTSLILDLRNNGGGSVDIMSSLGYLFTASLEERHTVSMYAEYKSGLKVPATITIPAGLDETSHLPAGTPVTILANNGTASASEALIGVLISSGVIGYSDIYLSDFSQAYLTASQMQQKNCRTYGKGIMQRTYTYVTGEALKLTVAKVYWPDGTTCIHDVGITAAEGCNTVKAEWNVTYGDEELQSVVAAVYTTP